jgi:hypothetical protein
MTTHHMFTAAEAQALLKGATPGPWSRLPLTVDLIGPAPLVCLRPLRDGDSDLLFAAPDLAASVVALHGEVERLRAILPPERERGQGIVGEGSWAVFAERVLVERDAAWEQARQATAAERARIVAWLKERADKAYAVGNEPYGNALLNASRILETSEATP